MNEKNVFLEMTESGLKEGLREELLAPRGFDIDENDKEERDCILVIGLNPSGKAEAAEREKSDRNYYYSLNVENSEKAKTEWVNNQ